MQKVLILAPHTDDGELGCGGTIAKLIEEESRVYYAAFSTCEQSVPEGMPKDVLAKEVRAATSDLGIDGNDLFIFDYPVRRFSENRQDILEDLIRLKKKICPDIIFMPSLHDIHQDHLTIAQEGMRAFKQTCLLCYETPWNNLTFDYTAFSVLDERHVKKKIDALSHYRSQRGIRTYMEPDTIEALSRINGVRAGVSFAEAFEVVRWII